MKSLTAVVAVLVVLNLGVSKALAAEAPEPGPEDGGLRLRLIVVPRADAEKEGYQVTLDLLNVSQQSITVRGGWQHETDTGDVKDYLEAATSIECVPAVAPWVGGVMQGHRTSPQPQQKLKAGEVLSASWKTDGRCLKNRVTDPNDVQNPQFPFHGLYSVHATLDVITAERTVRLRSNEQLVHVGGSHAMPKYTFGQLWGVEAQQKTATLGLGSLHKIAVGDQFEVGHPKGGHWKLTITQVQPAMSIGKLEALPSMNPAAGSALPQAHMEANLMR